MDEAIKKDLLLLYSQLRRCRDELSEAIVLGEYLLNQTQHREYFDDNWYQMEAQVEEQVLKEKEKETSQ